MFSFHWPIIFFLLPCLWIMQQFFQSRTGTHAAMLKVPYLAHLKTLNQALSVSTISPLKRAGTFAAWTLLIIAAANPQWLGNPLPIQKEGRNIMLAVDLSPSMSIPDLQRNDNVINRLQSVKTVAANFIDKRAGDKLGLILFGSKAYIQTPLTFDRETVRSMLDDATLGLAGDHTAIGDALGLAIQKLSAENQKSRILILLTDGDNNAGLMDPRDALQLAKQNHIKIYTVGIGASQLAVSNGMGTQVINPSADLDENLLKNIAKETHGRYFRAEDQAALTDILDAINQLEPVSSANKTARPVTALFYWPLSAALLLFTLILLPTSTMTRRR